MTAVWTRCTPVPRTFICRLCGDAVTVDKRRDRRTVFCCAQHEREYWRHYDRYQRKKSIDQGHVIHLRREASENAAERGER